MTQAHIEGNDISGVANNAIATRGVVDYEIVGNTFEGGVGTGVGSLALTTEAFSDVNVEGNDFLDSGIGLDGPGITVDGNTFV